MLHELTPGKTDLLLFMESAAGGYMRVDKYITASVVRLDESSNVEHATLVRTVLHEQRFNWDWNYEQLIFTSNRISHIHINLGWCYFND